MTELRSLVLVLGDQLDLESSAFDSFDSQIDAVWMAEVAEESTHVWSSRPRIPLFLTAMRHLALALQAAACAAHGRSTPCAGGTRRRWRRTRA